MNNYTFEVVTTTLHEIEAKSEKEARSKLGNILSGGCSFVSRQDDPKLVNSYKLRTEK